MLLKWFETIDIINGQRTCVVHVQTVGPAGHRRLQEAPSSKLLLHGGSVNKQMQMVSASDAKQASSEPFHGPPSSDFNIKASS